MRAVSSLRSGDRLPPRSRSRRDAATCASRAQPNGVISHAARWCAPSRRPRGHTLNPPPGRAAWQRKSRTLVAARYTLRPQSVRKQSRLYCVRSRVGPRDCGSTGAGRRHEGFRPPRPAAMRRRVVGRQGPSTYGRAAAPTAPLPPAAHACGLAESSVELPFSQPTCASAT